MQQQRAALQWWLRIVAGLRCFSVLLGYFNVSRFRTNLFTLAPEDQVSDLQGRTFGIWTSVTCMLCILAAENLDQSAIILATIGSFVIALIYFLLEYFIYQTISTAAFASPAIVASISTLWLCLFYRRHQKHQKRHSSLRILFTTAVLTCLVQCVVYYKASIRFIGSTRDPRFQTHHQWQSLVIEFSEAAIQTNVQDQSISHQELGSEVVLATASFFSTNPTPEFSWKLQHDVFWSTIMIRQNPGAEDFGQNYFPTANLFVSYQYEIATPDVAKTIQEKDDEPVHQKNETKSSKNKPNTAGGISIPWVLWCFTASFLLH